MGYATPIEKALLGYRASDNLLTVDTTEYNTTGTTYVKVADIYYIQPISYLSTLRFSADLKISPAGVAVIQIIADSSGTLILETFTSSTSYVEVYGDISMNDILIGESIGVYLKTNSTDGRQAFMKNLSIKGTQSPCYIG